MVQILGDNAAAVGHGQHLIDPIVVGGQTGAVHLCPAQDAEGLTRAMRDFAQQSFDRQVQMGQSGRALVERKFDKQLVVAKTLDGLGLPAAVRS